MYLLLIPIYTYSLSIQCCDNPGAKREYMCTMKLISETQLGSRSWILRSLQADRLTAS